MPAERYLQHDLRIDRSQGNRSEYGEVGHGMSKFERRQQFEALCQLRALYRLRGDWDSTSTISIDEVIAYAVRLLEDPRTLAVAIGTEGADKTPAPNPDAKR